MEKKSNLRFSQLIEEMRNEVSNLGRLAKGDTIIDIEKMVSDFEEQKYCPDLTDEDIYLHYWWGIRKNGTNLANCPSESADWYENYKREAIASYEIIYEKGSFSFEKIAEFNDPYDL